MEGNMVSRVLLFGGGLQCLTLARDLKSFGCYVGVAGMHNEIPAHSRFVDKCHGILDISSMTVSDLKRLTDEYGYGIIIPLEDEYTIWLSSHKSDVESLCKVKCAVEDGGRFSIASDKGKLMLFLEEKGFPHPRSCRIDTDLASAAEYVGFPALVKPDISNGSRGISIVNSMEELESCANSTLIQYGSCSLQEYLKAKSYYYNVMLYRCYDGSFAEHCIIRILRYYPINGGSSCLCQSVEEEKLCGICKDVLVSLDWHGFADFDVLEDGDGEFRIIEINPRVPASLRAASISGINFGRIIVSDMTNTPRPNYEYHTGRYLRYLGMDIMWFLKSPRRFSSRPSWFRFFGRDIFYQEGGKNDMKAMLMSFVIGIRKQFCSEFRRQKSGMN